MIFIRIGTFIAWALLTLGSLRVAMGLIVATTFDTPESMHAASLRYLATSNSGEAIDKGLWTLMAGVVLGLLTELAKNTRNRQTPP